MAQRLPRGIHNENLFQFEIFMFVASFNDCSSPHLRHNDVNIDISRSCSAHASYLEGQFFEFLIGVLNHF